MIRNDIARVEADVIVNPAPRLLQSSSTGCALCQAAEEQKQLRA